MNTELTFEEKIARLKQIHSHSAPEAIEQVNKWSDKFARLKAQKDWLEHPNTVELRKLAGEQINLIIGILADKEDLTEIDRKKYFAMKEAHMIYLSVLTDNPESEIAALEDSVTAEL